MTDQVRVLEEFARTVEGWHTEGEFRRLLASGRQIRIKYGVDVTAPSLHIGHAVNLWMMRRLQDLGHKVLFLIGDFTTRIGDPTGRDKTRPVIPPGEIEANAAEFIRQARMVLRFDDPDLLEIRRNSEWYAPMPAGELLHLLSMVTHSRLVSRDMFRARISSGSEIHVHELVYPVLQGYDSWALDSDLTIIGSDQLFNEMLGRYYQERLGQRPQVVITTRITPGLDGGAKQSKSLGNYVGLGHSPREKFGRVMRLPDHLILQWHEVYTDAPMGTVREMAERDPMGAKLGLASEIVRRYHGDEAAERERRWFTETFGEGHVPPDTPMLELEPGEYRALDLLRRFYGEAKSGGELRRLLRQGAVSRDGEAITEPDLTVAVRDGDVFRVGRRTWFRVRAHR